MAIKTKLYNMDGAEAGTIDLSEKVFGLKVNQGLVHQAAVAQESGQRTVIAHTKDRSEVRGGGRKPWRQKGTGRARAGSSRSPIWKGGGVTFGPTNERNFKKQINKKMKEKALLMVLSDKAASSRIRVLEKLSPSEPKTKPMASMLRKMLAPEAGSERLNVLVVNEKKDINASYSLRNLAGVKYLNLDNINILDLLKKKDLILTKAGVKTLEERYGEPAR